MAEKKNGFKLRKRSLIIGLVVFIVFSYLAGSFYSVQKSINETENAIAEVKAATELQNKENAELREQLNSGNYDEIIGDEARIRYDFAEQGERVYCDVSVVD